MSLNKSKSLPLRLGVGVVLLNSDNKVFVGKRIDNPVNFWQMPQGGVNDNENLLCAANRELKEETGVESIKFIKEIDNWLTYELPKNLLGKIWKGKYRGQKQKWFIMRFVGNEEEINIKTKNAEFLEWKWIDANQLLNVVIDFKLDVYKSIVKELNILLN
ncbi:MAG: RNA pyrophosphohydrolase [Pelagibacteraceae bacterium]|mgnify:CR=1 FL=1|jgi:putative (di)nucleoside polyphosphate hydrolase|nr:RNA pyrophosphohydrolase [Pelagibacteraceae bacterium]|tara:strand:- start:21458 stop:21937 length:480 start_codon:yes stop_codon:yes gene_type:complete